MKKKRKIYDMSDTNAKCWKNRLHGICQLALIVMMISAMCCVMVACDQDVVEQPTLPTGSILLSDLEKMQIVYDADGGEEYQELAESLCEAVEEATGITLTILPDNQSASSEYEIRLGACAGRENEDAVNALRINDYFCETDGKVIRIC